MYKYLAIGAILVQSLLNAHEGERPKIVRVHSQSEIILGEGEHRFKNLVGWGELPAGAETIGWTHGGVVVDSRDNFYVSSNQGNTVLVYDRNGTLLHQFGKQWKGIHSMVINKEGEQEFIYAARLWGSEIIKFNLDGSVAMRIKAIPPHEIYKNPKNKYKLTSVALSANGEIFAADGYGTDLIHKYDAKGSYLKSFKDFS
jgi:hypothetical protein